MKWLFSLFFSSFLVSAQDQMFEFIQDRDMDTLDLYCVNKTNELKQVFITVEGKDFQPLKRPIDVIVAPNDTVFVTKIRPSKAGIAFHVKEIVFQSRIVNDETVFKPAERTFDYTFEGDDLVIFIKKGEPASADLTNFLNINRFKYKMFDITKSDEVKKLVVETLAFHNDKSKNVKYPIVFFDNKLSHSHSKKEMDKLKDDITKALHKKRGAIKKYQ